MSSNTGRSATVSVGGFFSSLLSVALIALKLTGVIDWSWLWVLAPIWIPLAVVLLVLVVGFAVIGIATYFTK